MWRIYIYSDLNIYKGKGPNERREVVKNVYTKGKVKAEASVENDSISGLNGYIYKEELNKKSEYMKDQAQ